MLQHIQSDSEPWEDERENKRNNVYKDWVITRFFLNNNLLKPLNSFIGIQ